MMIQDINEIQEVVNTYFGGLFYGDTKKLKSTFHTDALLFGSVNNQPYCKNLETYLEGVQNRKSPNELKERFQMKIIGIEVMGNIALVKAHVPMLGFNYHDYLSMNKINDQWVIINKLFTDFSNN